MELASLLLRKMDKKTSPQAYRDWLLLALFFGYQYAARSCAGTFADEIRETFHIDADRFADFGAWCMLAYSCLQIPFGVVLDRIGIRRTILFSFGICLTGNYLFTNASTFEIARFGRLLLGIGAVPAYMSAVKVIADQFSILHAGFFIGCTRAFGSALVIFCNPLLKKCSLAPGQSWQSVMDIFNGFGALVFLFCFLFLSRRTTLPLSNTNPLRRSWMAVVSNPKIYLYGFLIIGTNTAVVALADLWGPSFLRAKYCLSEQQAVAYVQLIYAGMLVGSMLLPTMFMKKMEQGVRVCCWVLALIFVFLIDGSGNLSPFVLSSILLVFGFFSAVDMLFFAISAKLSTPYTSGLIASWLNSIGMLGEPLLQKWIGISLHRQGSTVFNEQGLRVYQASDYASAMQILLILSAVCLVLSYGLRESKNARS